jgi:hypothetical protein
MSGINITTRDARIKDPTGSLFNGNWVYFNARSVNFNYDNILVSKPITKVNWNPDSSNGESNIGDENNLIRRKNRVSYGGLNTTIIKVSGRIDLDHAGSLSSSVLLVTPGRLRQMFVTPRTYRFFDNKLGSALMYDDDSDVINPYSTNSGIPVIFDNLSFSSSKDSKNMIDYDITFLEDREE